MGTEDVERSLETGCFVAIKEEAQNEGDERAELLERFYGVQSTVHEGVPRAVDYIIFKLMWKLRVHEMGKSFAVRVGCRQDEDEV